MEVQQLKKSTGALSNFEKNLQENLEQARRSLSEVIMMLEQSETEINKLNQRNSIVTTQIKQNESKIDTLSPSEVKEQYQSALDAQQRLLLMRGQLEKLQNDRQYLEKMISSYEQVQAYLGVRSNDDDHKKGIKGAPAVLEMLINSQETERQRLSRQMHDGPVQALSNFIFQTEIVSRYFDIDANKAKEELNTLRTSAITTFQNVRDFILELRPMMLDDLGLLPTIRRYIDTIKDQPGLDIGLNISGQEQRFQPYLEVMIFRGIQELIGNVLRHNPDRNNKITIKVQIIIGDDYLKVMVIDNGKGFTTGSLHQGSGLGLKLIRERVEMLGGSMEIESAPGKGCQVTFQVPFLQETPKEPDASY